MKTLIVVTKSELGGAQVFASNLASGLKEKGEEVYVAGGPGEYLPEELAKAEIPFYRFQNLERSYNPFKVLKFISELKKYVKDEGFEVVHLNSTNALFGVWGLSGLKKKPKIVFTVHGLSFLDPNHKANPLISYLYQLFFKKAWEKVDKLVFVSHLNYEEAFKAGLAKKAEVIYNGLDLGPSYLFNREEARASLQEKTGADLINSYIYGSIGRLAYPKNYEFLIDSFLQVKRIRPEAKLLIIGEGPEREKYESLIGDLQNEVILAGEIKEAGRYLKAYDLFVLPSIFEGMSLSLIEAVLAGVPVLASKVGGSPEIVGEENCFELNNREDFLIKLKSVKAVPDTENRFSREKMVEAYLSIYKA